ncbi:ketosteroid isomerase-like protein [Catenulispora sp. MAP12-49]|uniref:nuclear transport factor 2 family protein n=1 Tax=unclassified Catenulispora TaxID=414885 RepID=UPI003518EDEA
MKHHSPRTIATLIGTTAVVAAVATAGAGTADASASRHLPKIVDAWAAAWNGTAPGALGALFTADGTYTDHGVGAVFHGSEGIAGWKAHADDLIDGVHVTVRAAYRDGDHITIEAVYAGHLKGAPHPFAVPMATLLDLRDPHQITSDQDFYSLTDVLAQSGLPAGWTPQH